MGVDVDRLDPLAIDHHLAPSWMSVPVIMPAGRRRRHHLAADEPDAAGGGPDDTPPLTCMDMTILLVSASSFAGVFLSHPDVRHARLVEGFVELGNVVLDDRLELRDLAIDLSMTSRDTALVWWSGQHRPLSSWRSCRTACR